MPDSIDHYVRSLLELVAASPVVRSSNIVLDKRTLRSALVRGDLYFLDGSRLHFRELIDVQASTVRLMYSYHYQKADGALVFRYDDTPHHTNVPGFPFHKHVSQEDTVIAAEPPDLRSVLQEIQNIYPIDTASNA